MKLLLIVTGIILEGFADENDSWLKFKAQFNKTYYKNGEEKIKEIWFKNNENLILQHNKEQEAGKFNYTLRINKYSDLDEATFTETICGFRMSEESKQIIKEVNEKYIPDMTDNLRSIPLKFNWMDFGAVTSVKDQGNCASCYAFGVAAALESKAFLSDKGDCEFSPQELMDCPSENNGCNGGSVHHSLSFSANRGISWERDYPYLEKSSTCKYNQNKAFQIDCHSYIPSNIIAIKEALHKYGPLVVAIDASSKAFQQYGGGVYSATFQMEGYLNHVVLLVGWLERAWIVKNSWGRSWGIDGFFLLDMYNDAGMNNYVVTPSCESKNTPEEDDI